MVLGELVAAVQAMKAQRGLAEDARLAAAVALRAQVALREDLATALAAEGAQAAAAAAEARRWAEVAAAAAAPAEERVAAWQQRQLRLEQVGLQESQQLDEEIGEALAELGTLRSELRANEAFCGEARAEEAAARREAEALRLELHDLHQRAGTHIAMHQSMLGALRQQVEAREQRHE